MTTYPGDMYGGFGGSSSAQPHVAGTAALIQSAAMENSTGLEEFLPVDQVRCLLQETADPVAGDGRDPDWGRVNAGDATSSAPTAEDRRKAGCPD